MKRCISIGEELRRLSHNVKFLINREPYFANIIRKSGFKTAKEIDSTTEYDMSIVDSYSMDESEFEKFKRKSKTLVRIDDAAPAVVNDIISDVVINGNPYATKEMYSDHVRRDCILMVGSSYIPMDRSFRKARSVFVVRENINELAITFGASEVGRNYAYRIVENLYSMGLNVYTNLLIPFLPDSTNKDNYAEIGKSTIGSNLIVLPYISDIERIFQKCDLAICSASTTCWQLAAIGVPFITFETASNQSLAFRYVQDRKIGIGLHKEDISNGKLEKEIANLNRTKRELLSKRSRQLIDCNGSTRIADALDQIR